ncbi:MAG: asparagine synthase (glutamine-hydrolyzing) [Sedimentisphaerales bacterium]|nr:asparagine synthase (glutamine-hydrolyzing) [Sedimentisphaerales bacterium]
MCGISGILHLKGPRVIDPDQVLEMVSIQRHRGPEESGLYLDDWIGLGHARLSIVDLRCGTQPIHNETGRYWIVYNGEVFNWPQLRAGLEARGHHFYTQSDTEVIIHLYEEEGLDCLHQLNGQFAMAIWDAQDKRLVLARDRLGIRPLHYTIWHDKLIFASEAKAIFTIQTVPRKLDPTGLVQVFTFWSTLPGRTVFKDVYEVPAGHYLVAHDGQISVGRYWDIPLIPSNRIDHLTMRDLVCQAKDLLEDSVRIRLRADVPVGCYISGGLDSSGVACLASKYSTKLMTFGIRFEEEPFDEGQYQSTMVEHLGVDHHQIQASNAVIAKSLPEAIWYTERPLLRTAPVPLLLLSRLVRTCGMKVVLTGEGADEVFGGYDIFKETKVRRFWARRPQAQRRANLIDELYKDIFHDIRSRQLARAFFAKGLDQVNDPFYSHRLRWENTSRLQALFSDDFNHLLRDYDPYEDLLSRLPPAFFEADWLTKAQYLETYIFLSQYLLSSQGDRMAMANSVEIRLPYLDYRVVEFMAGIPPRWKILGLNEKFLLKKVFDGLLPNQILSRTKQPYRAPIWQSLLGPAGMELVHGSLAGQGLVEAGVFDQAKAVRLLEKSSRFGALGEVDSMGLVGMVTTQLLYDRFIRRPVCEVTRCRPNLFVDHRSDRGLHAH